MLFSSRPIICVLTNIGLSVVRVVFFNWPSLTDRSSIWFWWQSSPTALLSLFTSRIPTATPTISTQFWLVAVFNLTHLLTYLLALLLWRNRLDFHSMKWIGLCESSFLLLEYSIEYLIEYSSTRWIPEVAINHRVVQNKRIPGSSFKFVV